MEKMQILFPEPQLKRLRDLARSQDRPVSELVRAAVDAWLARNEARVESVAEAPPTYCCGALLVEAGEIREAAYSDRDLT